MRFLICLLMCFTTFTTLTATAQETVTVSVSVTNSLDGQPVLDATTRLLRDGQTVTQQTTVNNNVQDRPAVGANVEILRDGASIASGVTDANGLAEIVFSSVDAERETQLPRAFTIGDVRPNPGTGRRSVTFGTEIDRTINIGVYDILGRKILDIPTSHYRAGEYNTTFNLDGLSAGVYLINFSTQGISQTAKITHTGNTRGSTYAHTPIFVKEFTPEAQTTTLSNGVFEQVVSKPGYETHTSMLDVQDGDEGTYSANVSFSPTNPHVGVLTAGGIIGEEVCLTQEELETVVDLGTATLETILLESNSAGLSINNFCFIATEQGTHAYTMKVKTTVGGETQQTQEYAVTPTNNILVRSYVGDLPESLMPFIIKNPGTASADTTYNTEGVFTIPLGALVHAGFTKEGEPFSYLTQRTIGPTTQEMRVIDYYLRDITGAITGELASVGEIGDVSNSTGFRHWNIWTHYESNAGISRWNMNPDILPTAPGTFNGFREGSHGIVPDEIILAHISYVEPLDETSYLTEHVRNIILTEFENYVRPILGEDRTITEVDSLSVNPLNNVTGYNRLLILPWSHTPPGVRGRLHIYGWEPDNIGNIFTQIQSKASDPTNNPSWDAILIKAFHEEVFGGVGFYNAISGDPSNAPDLTLPHQSVTYDGQSGVIRPTVYDIKRARIANLFTGMVDDVFIMPNQEGTSQTSSNERIQLLDPLKQYTDKEGNNTYESMILDSKGRPYTTSAIPTGTDLTERLEQSHLQRTYIQDVIAKNQQLREHMKRRNEEAETQNMYAPIRKAS